MPALIQIKQPLMSLHLFHTDKEKAFVKQLLSKHINTFNLQRLLSKKACPYDSEVEKAIFRIM
jgi:hypothetical protein